MAKRTARLFLNGGSQAVRLPAEFRFNGNEVFIRKDENTGDVILSRKEQNSWDDFFALRDKGKVTGRFMADRPLNAVLTGRNLFGK